MEADTLRAQKVQLAKALYEKRRRQDLGIERHQGDDAWYDVETNKPLTELEVIKREVQLEKNRPLAVDLKQ